MERYCAYQERCHVEVDKKLLEMRMIPEAREVILLHLLENDFLNEQRFAMSFARGKFRIKGWGKVRITRELKQRQISPYVIKKAVGQIEEEDYLKALKELARKKYNSLKENSIWKKRRKVSDFLLYRGFESDLVHEAIDAVEQEERKTK